MGLENFDDAKGVAVYAFDVAISYEEDKLNKLYQRYGRRSYGWKGEIIQSQIKILNDLKTIKRKKL